MSESNENPAAPWVDPVGLFLSDPESHLSDILYIYFRHYKKRLVFDLLREALRAVENRPDPIVVADVGASMGFDLLYVTRRLRMAGNSILLSRLHLLFLEGDPRLRAEGETMWASAAKKEFPFEFREAFLTEPGPFVEVVSEAAAAVTGRNAELSTTGGTSDARFIRALCPVVELGLVGASMHAVDEQAPVADIQRLAEVYRGVIGRYFKRFG